MPDLFTKTNVDREEEAMGGKPRVKPKPPEPPPKPPVDFTRSLPKDPEKEKARAAAKLRLLREQDKL